MANTRHRTALGDWLKLATPTEREALAKHAKVSLNYLYQLAGVHRENPKVRLALALVAGANAIRSERLAYHSETLVFGEVPLPLLCIEHIALPTRQ